MFWLLLAPGMELAELRLVTRATGRLGEATGPGASEEPGARAAQGRGPLGVECFAYHTR
jgi:hypothetical protein